MKKRGKVGLILLGASIPVLVIGAVVAAVFMNRTNRPSAPPNNAVVTRPWGAINFQTEGHAAASGLQDAITASIKNEGQFDFDIDRDGVKEYDILAISGGGSYGAFGAGLLSGWTARGNRIDFKVVTGISTGALLATPAFLGSAYDQFAERIFTGIQSSDVYLERSILGKLASEGTLDSTPLRRLLEREFTDELLAAVAERYRRGHRLFVGTSSMDSSEFVMWDMGLIAASGRPDARRRYIDVLIASCAVPVVFPPVYFEVEVNGKVYHEMHADGGAEAQFFFRGFMLDFEDALAVTERGGSRSEVRLFIIRNNHANAERIYNEVESNPVAIATATIKKVFEGSTASSFYRIYRLADFYGIDFNFRCIPADYELTFDPLDFDTAAMKKLFNLGVSIARSSDDWIKVPPGLDPDEVIRKAPEGIEPPRKP